MQPQSLAGVSKTYKPCLFPSWPSPEKYKQANQNLTVLVSLTTMHFSMTLLSALFAASGFASIEADLWKGSSFTGEKAAFVRCSSLPLISPLTVAIASLQRTYFIGHCAQKRHTDAPCSGVYAVGFTAKSWKWTNINNAGCCVAFCKDTTVGICLQDPNLRALWTKICNVCRKLIIVASLVPNLRQRLVRRKWQLVVVQLLRTVFRRISAHRSTLHVQDE